MPKQALIVELESYHGFIIPSQHAFLKDAGYEVHILVTDKLTDLDLIETLGETAVITIVERHNRANELLKIRLQMMQGRYDFVVFNSIPQSKWLQCILGLMRHHRVVIHNVESEYFAVARRVRETRLGRRNYYFRRLALCGADRYYLLSNSVYISAAEKDEQQARLEYFYPSYFPTLEVRSTYPKTGRIVFTILGAIDNTRRNYESLISCFEAISQSALTDQIELRFLGNTDNQAGVHLLDIAQRNGILGSVVVPQTKYKIPFQAYAEKLSSSHFVLLLIDRHVTKKYNKTLAPSSLMLGRGFAVPFVSSSDFSPDPDLLPYTVFYEGQAVLDGIQKAVELAHSPQYEIMRNDFRQHMEALYPEMQQRYVH